MIGFSAVGHVAVGQIDPSLPTTPNSQWWVQPPDLLRHAAHLDTNQSFDWSQLPLALTPKVWWWMQPPDLLRRIPHLDTNEPRLQAQQWATPQIWWWSQPPDLLRRIPPPDTNFWTLPFATLQRFDTPDVMWWSQPPNLLRHLPTVDINQGLMDWWQALPVTPNTLWWAQPPDLLRHATHLDTNQGLDIWYAPLSTIPAITPASWWWTQPPDLLRHATHLDTNQPRLVSQQFATASRWWWTQPPDLLWHAQTITDQSHRPPPGAFPGQNPQALWWVQPPDLLRHATHLDTNQWTLPFASFARQATPDARWWSQPPDLLRHATHLDTNQWTLPFASFNLRAPPSSMWWSQPPDLLRHPTYLDTNQPLNAWTGAIPFTPSLWWWSQPPDLLRHPPRLDTNQGFDYAFEFLSKLTSNLFWWSQPPDLLHHPNRLDTNQPIISFRDADTPPWLSFWRQSPDTPRRAPELAPAAPYIGPLPSTATPGVMGFWQQPQFQPPRAPGLWFDQPYETRGDALSVPQFILPPAGLIMRAPPGLAGILGGVGRDFPITPRILARFDQPFLLKHPPELWTWQHYIGEQRGPRDTPQLFWWKQPPDLLRKPAGDITQPWTHIVGWRWTFMGAAFIVVRSPPLSAARVAPRHLIAVAEARKRLVIGKDGFPRVPDLTPPITAEVEREKVIFDFGQFMAQPSAINSIIAVQVAVESGNDPDPMTRLLSNPVLIASPSTGLSDMAVEALFGNMLAGVVYVIRCVVKTLDGHELMVEARWPCKAAI